MKILLIYPYFSEERINRDEISVIPIGLYSIAAFVKKNGYDVEILNWHDINRFPEKIKKTLIEKRPDIIGFSIMNANRWGGIDIARIAKGLDPDVKIVFGGIGATFLWEHILTHFPEIDYVVTGEGEYSFLNLIRSIKTRTGHRLDDIKGIAFRDQGKIIRTEDAQTISDLDELPIPAVYFNYNQISSSRGCANSCSFCGSPQFWGRRIRFRSPGHFVHEIELLYRRGITFFYVADDTFTVNKDRVIEICRLIMKRDIRISWYAISRVDHVDEDILFWMRRAGCVQISYGVESGSEKIRNFLNKRIKKEQIVRAFKMTSEYGILARAYFIYGSRGETWDTIRETIDLIHEIRPLGIISYVLDIFPGTELYNDLRKRSDVTDDIWLKRIEDIPYCETDPALTNEEVMAFGKALRSAFYENVHTYAGAVQLLDKKELYPLHSDFLSRLGMTFSHGDYSRINEIREKELTAEKLFNKALSYFPDHRAYLGLGIIKQKKRDFRGSIEILLHGIGHFPESEDLNICLAISYLHIGEQEKALSRLIKFPESERAKQYMESIGAQNNMKIGH